VLILWLLPCMIFTRLSRLITGATSTTVPVLYSPNWFENFMQILRWYRMMTMGLSYSLPLQVILLCLILRLSAKSLECQFFRSLSVLIMKLYCLLPWMSFGNSFMLSLKVRSDLLLLGLVLCLSCTACLPRSSSLLLGELI
jgi:hypothetical protein